jgi:hypothetical protein
MGDDAAVSSAVTEPLQSVLLSHAAALAQCLSNASDDAATTPRSDAAFDTLALLAHLATASAALRALVKARAPALRAVGEVARAKRDAMRAICAELARYGLPTSSAAPRRGAPPGDAAAALQQALSRHGCWLIRPSLDALETSPVPPNVVLVSDLAVELAFRLFMREAHVQLCSDEEHARAYNAATRKHLSRTEPRPRFFCPRGVTTVEVMREARDAGFITAERCDQISHEYAATAAALRAMTAREHEVALPLMPQRAADMAAAWAAFARYVEHRLRSLGLESARLLLLQDAGVRAAYHVFRALHLNTHSDPEQLRRCTESSAKRGSLGQRSLSYIEDVSSILCGGFPINAFAKDVRSLDETREEDDWSTDEESTTEDEDHWTDDDDVGDDEEDGGGERSGGLTYAAAERATKA